MFMLLLGHQLKIAILDSDNACSNAFINTALYYLFFY